MLAYGVNTEKVSGPISNFAIIIKSKNEHVHLSLQIKSHVTPSHFAVLDKMFVIYIRKAVFSNLSLDTG